MKKVILKPGKEKAIQNRHHWIFSGAIAEYPEFEEGEILSLFSSKGNFLGSAYFNRNCSIAGRIISFDETPPHIAIEQNLDAAILLRKRLFDFSQTNSFRLINGEGDALPGLVVDRYNDTLVIQFSTLGMERLRDLIIDLLKQKINPKAIYEKSTSPSRKEEGLKPVQGIISGNIEPLLEIKENGLPFYVSVAKGQKTGFFLDHREMRKWVGEISNKKTVLNCFCYTGAFSIYAAAGGATQVDSVDISEDAIQLAKQNFDLNGFNTVQNRFFTADIFEFLREKELNYDLIILDPPAFAKKKGDLVSACRGYKDINRLAMQKMPKGSILLTSSCSYFVDIVLFQKVIFQAAFEAKRSVKILGYHRMAPDHPINIFHPEADYLKSLLLYVE